MNPSLSRDSFPSPPPREERGRKYVGKVDDMNPHFIKCAPRVRTLTSQTSFFPPAMRLGLVGLRLSAPLDSIHPPESSEAGLDSKMPFASA